MPSIHRALVAAVAFVASSATLPHLALADDYCVPGTPLCASTSQGGVRVGGPKVSAGGTTSGTVQGTAGGNASGQFKPPPVQGTVGGGTVSVATPALDLSWMFTAAGQLAAGASASAGAGAEVQVAPPPPPTPVWARGGGWHDDVYAPDWGIGVCGGVQVTSSFVGPAVCIATEVFPLRWLSIENDLFYTYGESPDDTPAHAELERHAAVWQPSVAFHAQADIARLSGRIGGTLEIGGVGRDRVGCGASGSPGPVASQPLCTPLDDVDEARAYAGAMTGVTMGLAKDFVFLFDLRFVAKARIDAGDRDDPLGRAELGGLFLVRIGGESSHVEPR